MGRRGGERPNSGVLLIGSIACCSSLTLFAATAYVSLFEPLTLLSTAVSCARQSRQAKPETGSAAACRFEPHVAAMIDHDLACDASPRPQPFDLRAVTNG